MGIGSKGFSNRKGNDFLAEAGLPAAAKFGVGTVAIGGFIYRSDGSTWFKDAGGTTFTPPAAAADVPGQVLGLTVGAITSTSIALSWTAPGGTPTDYKVEFKTETSTVWGLFSDGVSATASTTVTGLSPGTIYNFRVSAINASGTGPASAVASASTSNAVPAQVIGLVVTNLTYESLTLTWAAPAGIIYNYKVEYKLSASGTWLVLDKPTTTDTTVNVQGLAGSSGYDFRVSAGNSAGFGTVSAIVSATTPLAPPGKITDLSVASKTTSSVTLAWSAPSGTPTDYKVEFKREPVDAWLVFSDGTSATTGATVTGLIAGFSYQFRVSATNAAGFGAVSNVVTVATSVVSAPTLGEYLFWMTNSLTPAIGSAMNISGQVVSGYVRPVNATTSVLFLVSGSPVSDMATTSMLLAYRYKLSTDGEVFFVACIGGTNTVEVGALTGIPATGVNAKAQSGDSSIFARAGGTVSFPGGSASERTVVFAYDAVSNTSKLWVDGVGGIAGTPTPLTANFTLSTVFLGAGSNAIATPEYRDIHFIRFVNSPLPTDLNALVAAFHATPLTKLTTWAV